MPPKVASADPRCLKILMLIPELGYGGAEGAFLRLARELSRWHRVEIAVFRPEYGEARYARATIETELPITVLDEEGRRGRTARWARRFSKLRKLKRDLRADVTISFLSGANVLNVVARAADRTVVSVRGSRKYELNQSAAARHFYKRFLDPLTYASADAVVSVSEGLSREISRGGWKTASRKYRAISGYVDCEALYASAAKPVEPELEALAGSPVAIAAGRLSVEKGFQHLIRVFAGVRRVLPSAKLVLIGDGPMRGELERLCGAHGLSYGEGPDSDPSVLLLGYRTDPIRYFRLAKAYVLCSSNEGFPNVAVEALAAGIPVIAADAPWGAREALGVGPDPRNEPFPTIEPTAAPYGTLMPRIDDWRFEEAWARVIAERLAAPGAAEDEILRRHERARQLSCAQAGRKWSDLLLELCGYGAAPPDDALEAPPRTRGRAT